MHKGFRVNISFHFSWIRMLEWENLGGMVGVHLHFQGAANRLQSGRGLVQPPRRCARVRLSASSPARRAVSLFLQPSPYGRLTVVPASVFLCVIPISALSTCLNLWLLSKHEVVFLIIGCCDFLWGGRDTESIGFMIRAYLLPVCIARLFSSLSCVF